MTWSVRRLDFLIQEMNREVNTLGSKASDAFVSKIVVEMKGGVGKTAGTGAECGIKGRFVHEY